MAEHLSFLTKLCTETAISELPRKVQTPPLEQQFGDQMTCSVSTTQIENLLYSYFWSV